METEAFQTLLNFFKVMGNESRLKIIGILANQDCTVRELATMLKVKEPTVSEHLAMLKEAELVTVKPDGNHRIYSINVKTLHSLNKDIFSRVQLASLVDDVPDDSERKVLQTFFDGERLAQIPVAGKKFSIVLKWLANQFEFDVRYPEKQVNEILGRFNEDYATLRRGLIDEGFMQREKGIYWRLPAPAE